MLRSSNSHQIINEKPSESRRLIFKKIFKLFFATSSGITLLLFCFLAWVLYPHKRPQILPSDLIGSDTVEGQKLLQLSTQKADHKTLFKNFEPQIFSSFCGVASSVIVLNSLGLDLSQNSFFARNALPLPNPSDFTNVLLSGMTLGELDQFLKQKGAHTNLQYASQLTLDSFRSRVVENLANPNDFMIINYYRDELGQGKTGHISPISAYEPKSDKVLILDTASHRYPHTWVPINRLFTAMKAVDSSSERSRGFIEVSNKT